MYSSPPSCSVCSVVPWLTASTRVWREARLLNRSSAGHPCPDNSTPPCWMQPGTAALTHILAPLQPQRGEWGVEGIEADEEEEGAGAEAEARGERGRRWQVRRSWTTGSLSWWAGKALMGEEAAKNDGPDVKDIPASYVTAATQHLNVHHRTSTFHICFALILMVTFWIITSCLCLT